ncbi:MULTISPECIES: hypothetical protein [unclassified Serratia (in: enterobacteria)]|uniref:hypothetical protein n=1 Tax=unclassified Serratia (in: enterobacteria) TaxID=2647522 RepID=UPI00046902C2|nr:MULTISPECIES: hypothetical protein [unclassified Serratia (in: enterobacteria)]
MTISGKDFLDSSTHCLENECEAGFRNAVSRAYYSMFHKAHEELSNIPRCNNNHHANLIKYMKGDLGKPEEKLSAARLKILGYELRQMRQARNESDYKLVEASINKNVAIESIETAKHFFERISS